MDIEKICRTCLSLNGPLLSIYDGGGGSGCIADMLRDFTKTKPRRVDKLPEKVCLACISEINRCYSFKLKCENSSRTLRQLVPDALPEETENRESNLKVEQAHKEIQTEKEILKQVTTACTQTNENIEVERTNQYVQTQPICNLMEDKSTSPIVVGQNKMCRYEKTKSETNSIDHIEKSVSKKIQRRSNTRQTLALKRRRLGDNCFEQAEEDESQLIMEIHTEETQINDNEEAITLYSTLHTAEEEETNEDTTTYYQISRPQSENESENVVALSYNLSETHQTRENSDEFEEDGAYAHFVYAEENDEFNTGEENAQTTDYNFTIYKSGDTEEVAEKKSKGRSANLSDINKLPNAKRELKCSYCSMTFVNPTRLARHEMKLHKNEDAYNINKTENERKSIKHLEISDDDDDPNSRTKALKADITLKGTSITPQPIVQKTKPSELTYFCETCGAGFAMRRSLVHHRKQNLCNKVTYDCDKCQRVFISEEALKDHKITHLQEHECTECYKNFSTNDELSQHMVVEHKRNLRNQCHICKKVFTILSALKDHLRVHSGEKPFICSICSKGFSQKANLKQHEMRHNKEKKFKCDECSWGFVTKAELSSHRRTHTGEHPFRCDECQATFTISSSLLKHKRIHTGERPYACDLCPKRFTTSFTLKNHRRIHTGERPFKCRWCSKSFTQKQDCVIHHRTHTGERNHACFCGEKFTHLGTLRTHQKTHEINPDDGTLKPTSKGKRRRRICKREPESGDEAAFNITILNEDDDDDGNAEDDATVVTVAREDMERLVAGETIQSNEERNTVAVNEEKLMQMAIEEV
ncbi:zinc finger protein 354A [Ceratitis capitata]|uniref:(Mediterranean fruit fly) hypothetical protein n=2 Tax=Ceratitis capitata TaxID=7213 RepID=A0A811TZK7_CERCA|nr:zinc finger protein 354A [Ceratitis capitata]XP_012162673.1 zinc finger protein 354A [Ceratitis capitata]CAD6991516.1 unnamed protein product [Ceratitis capitata]